MNSATDDMCVYRIKKAVLKGLLFLCDFGGRLYSRRLTAPSGVMVDGAAGLTPWAPRVLSGTG